MSLRDTKGNEGPIVAAGFRLRPVWAQTKPCGYRLRLQHAGGIFR